MTEETYMEKKYELIESDREGLYRIKALKDFCNEYNYSFKINIILYGFIRYYNDKRINIDLWNED